MFKSILLVCSLILGSCATTPLPNFSEKENGVLFIKDHIPEESYKCKYLGSVSYEKKDNPGGLVECAVYKRQAWVLVKKASDKDANLVVANFSKDDPGAYVIGDDPICENKAKIFQCPSASLSELKKYE